MLLNEKNIINKELFEFEIETRENLSKIEFQIQDLLNVYVPDIIEKTAEKYFGREDYLQINKVEIDLKNLSINEFESQFKKRFEKNIDDYFYGLSASNVSELNDSENVNLFSANKGELELFKHYFFTGTLPWWFNNRIEINWNTILEKLLENKLNAALQIISQLLNNNLTYERFSNLISTKTISLIQKQIIYQKVNFNQLLLKFFSSITNRLSKHYPHKRLELKLVSFYLNLNNPDVEKITKFYFSHILNNNFEPEFFRQNIFDIIMSESISETTFKSLDTNIQSLIIIEIIELLQIDFSLPVNSIATINEKNKNLSPELYFQKLEEIVISVNNLKYNKNILDFLINRLMANLTLLDFENQKNLIKHFDLYLKSYSPNDKIKFYDLIKSIYNNSIKTFEEIEEPISPEVISETDKIFEKEKLTEEDDIIEENTSYFIRNAGLILIAPFLPRLFQNLNLLNENKELSIDNKQKATQIIQYIINSDIKAPEYQLMLNKILCGIELNQPLNNDVELTEEITTNSQSLLKSIISNWEPLKNTSIEGFQKSFLIRNGKLSKSKNGWELKVERKPYDMLLESLPYSFSKIKFSWMKEMVITEW